MIAPDNNFLLPPPPPPGQAHTRADNEAVIQYVDGIMEEAYSARRELEPQCERNNNLHLGRSRLHALPNGVTAVDVNRVRNVDIAHVQVQTESTPRIKFMPRETAEPGTAFIDVRVEIGDLAVNGVLKDFFLSLPPQCWQPDAGGNVQPLDDASRALVENAIESGLLPGETLIVVNDRSIADGKQTVFDAMWEDCSADFYVREAAFRKTIIGWQFMLYGFDDHRRRHVLFNPSHLQVFIDPLCTDIRDAAHAELLQWMDLYRAKALWPEYGAEFNEAVIPPGAYLDSQGSTGSFTYRIPEAYRRTQFKRPMVAVRHAWIRDYPFPLSIDEALAAGHIAVPPPPPPPPTPPQPAMGTDGQPVGAGESGMEATPAGGEEGQEEDNAGQVADDAPAAAGGAGDAVAPPQYVRTTTGLPIDPAEFAAAGLTRPGIREICIVGRTVVRDRQTEYGDIPLSHYVDLPILDSPYGQGQPEALESLQLGLDALVTDIMTHFHFVGAPAIAMPTGVAQRLPGFKEGVYAAPHSQVWEVPDDLIQKYGDISKLVQFIEAPALPADFWRFYDLLLSLIDKEGQVTEALEGEGKAHWSGDMVSRLQEAARGLIGWKSQRMEHALEYLCKLMLHTIETRLTVQELAQHCSKFPTYVWAYIKTRPSSLQISVEIVSGSGQLQEQAKNEALELWAQGTGPLSGTTLLERFGEDPKQELRNKVTEAEERAKAMQTAAPVMGGAGGAMGGGAPMGAPPPMGAMIQGAPPAVGGAPPGQPVAAAA